MLETGRRAAAGMVLWLAAAGVGAPPPQAPARKQAAAPAPPAAKAAPGPRSAVAFGFGGKLGPKDEGFVPGFESYKLRFGPGDWAGARIVITSAWGDKNPDTDLWHWLNGLEVRTSDVLSDKDGAYFIYSLATANADDWIVANFRYTLRDGRNGVASAVIPYGGDPTIPRDTIAVLGFGGKLGPKDEGYLPDFESYKLRFGPGDWEGTTIGVAMSWGEGSGAMDHWGWKDLAETRTSELRRDAQGAYFVHSLHKEGHARWVASLFRFTRKDGRHGVARAIHSYLGALAPPVPHGEPAGFPSAPTIAVKRPPKPTPRALAAARVTPADLKYLQGLTDELQGMEPEDVAEITKLNLDEKPIDDAGMAHLRGLKALRSLSLRNTRVGDAGLENIAGLQDLQALTLIGTPTTDAGLQVVGRLAGLVELHVDQTLVTDAGLRSLRGHKNLRQVTLTTTDVGDAGISALKEVPDLRRLVLSKDPGYVSEPITKAGLATLRTFPNLMELELTHLPIGDDELAQLKGARKLYLLNLWATRVTDAGLVHLQGLPELNQLTLDETPVTGAGLGALKKLPELKYLFLGFGDIGDAGMAHIGELKDLEVLQITKGNVTDAGFAHIAKLTKLDRMRLPDNKITGAGLASLRGLTALYELNLYYNKLDDDSLAVFASLPELRDLYISGDRITDAGLAHLKGLANLRYLNISWTKVTEAGLDDLRKALPDLRIDHGDF
ncbi:leucine-rich repeat domain-containing protein [Paludisphaera soli]|uniref:leucine-rich repeat domain-containing protein n=1 Tax=Paludisphaera soli TaxID=2712865 RepID=UPI0013EDB443|nr:hypothetical protein [Paludisphaera soli]